MSSLRGGPLGSVDPEGPAEGARDAGGVKDEWNIRDAELDDKERGEVTETSQACGQTGEKKRASAKRQTLSMNSRQVPNKEEYSANARRTLVKVV